MNGPLSDVPSPCVKVCVMDEETGLCVGCYRSLAEIGGWGDFSAAQKRAVLARIEERIRRWGPPASTPGAAGGPRR